MGREREVGQKQLETVQMAAAKKVLEFSNTTSIAILRAEMGMYPLKHKTREKVEMTIPGIK